MNPQGSILNTDEGFRINLGYKLKQRSGHKIHFNRFSHFKKKESRTKKVIHEIEKYCQNASLHGLRYIGDPTISIYERFVWLVSFVGAAFCAAYFISNIYLKWNMSPVIISFSPFDADMDHIPFPGITFCNMNQINKDDAEEIIKYGPPIQQKLLNDFCGANVSIMGDLNETNKLDAVQEYLIHVGQSCEMVLRLCQWKSEEISCHDNFNNELLDEGLCCSFNRLPPHIIMHDPKIITLLNQTYPDDIYDWSPETGYPENLKYNSKHIPRRPLLGSGVHMGLTLVMDAQIDNVFCSSTMGIGFKMRILNPIDTPKMSYFGSLLSPGFETRIAITPVIREASPTLRNVAIEKRACYFASERRLRYYRMYTRTNCEFECLSNYTLKECNCVPYHLPHSPNAKVCDRLKDGECVQRTRAEMEEQKTHLQHVGSDCLCFPSCNEVFYTYTQSFTRLVYNRLPFQSANSSITDQDYFVKNIAVAHFYFENTQFTQIIKSEVFAFTDFLSNTGGLLGVFIGFSILSVFEILYFIWTQFVNILKRWHQNRKFRQTRIFCMQQSRLPFVH